MILPSGFWSVSTTCCTGELHFHSLFFSNDSGPLYNIRGILKDILDLFHGGRVYIFEYDEYYRYQDCTYEVVAEGVAGDR